MMGTLSWAYLIRLIGTSAMGNSPNGLRPTLDQSAAPYPRARGSAAAPARTALGLGGGGGPDGVSLRR